MNNSSLSYKSIDKRLLMKYPMLQEVLKDKGRLGPIRVLRKSPKEIKSVLEALPNQYFNFEYYDCHGDALQFGYEDHLILWLETNMKDLPVFTQTVIYLVKESNMTITQLNQIKKADETLSTVLNAQILKIDSETLEKVVGKARELIAGERIGISVAEDQYLEDAIRYIKEANYSNRGLENLRADYGYNSEGLIWDIKAAKEIIVQIPEGFTPIKLYVRGRGGAFGYTTNSFEPVSKEEFVGQELEVRDYYSTPELSKDENHFGTGDIDNIACGKYTAYSEGNLYVLIRAKEIEKLQRVLKKYGEIAVFDGNWSV